MTGSRAVEDAQVEKSRFGEAVVMDQTVLEASHSIRVFLVVTLRAPLQLRRRGMAD